MKNQNYVTPKQVDLELAVGIEMDRRGIDLRRFDPSMDWGDISETISEAAEILRDANDFWYELEG